MVLGRATTSAFHRSQTAVCTGLGKYSITRHLPSIVHQGQRRQRREVQAARVAAVEPGLKAQALGSQQQVDRDGSVGGRPAQLMGEVGRVSGHMVQPRDQAPCHQRRDFRRRRNCGRVIFGRCAHRRTWRCLNRHLLLPVCGSLCGTAQGCQGPRRREARQAIAVLTDAARQSPARGLELLAQRRWAPHSIDPVRSLTQPRRESIHQDGHDNHRRFVLSPSPAVRARRLHTTPPHPIRVGAASPDASFW